MKKNKEDYSTISTTQLYNDSIMRNSSLNEAAEAEIYNYFSKIKESLENYVKFYSKNKIKIKLNMRNLNIYITEIDENFKQNVGVLRKSLTWGQI